MAVAVPAVAVLAEVVVEAAVEGVVVVALAGVVVGAAVAVAEDQVEAEAGQEARSERILLRLLILQGKTRRWSLSRLYLERMVERRRSL